MLSAELHGTNQYTPNNTKAERIGSICSRESCELRFNEKLGYQAITAEYLRDLVKIVNRKLLVCNLFNNYRVERHAHALFSGENLVLAHITCASDSFHQREAITFHSNGRITFAAWADYSAVEPILCAFSEWVESIAAKCVG